MWLMALPRPVEVTVDHICRDVEVFIEYHPNRVLFTESVVQRPGGLLPPLEAPIWHCQELDFVIIQDGLPLGRVPGACPPDYTGEVLPILLRISIIVIMGVIRPRLHI